MGLFDTIKSSYDIGEELTNVECQTKDIENTMSFYWIDPLGHLWAIDYRGTSTPHLEEEERTFPFFKWKPTGKHGKVRRHYLTDYVTVYAAKPSEELEDWFEVRIHFEKGKVKSYEKVTRLNNMRQLKD